MEEEELAQKVEELHGGQYEPEVPTIYSQVTNWEPHPMMKLKEFLYRIDKGRPDFFKDLKNDHPPRIDYRKYQESELDKEELEALKGVQKEYFDENYNTYITVEKCMDNSIKWENPLLVDA